MNKFDENSWAEMQARSSLMGQIGWVYGPTTFEAILF